MCIMAGYQISCNVDECEWKSVPCDTATGVKFLNMHMLGKHRHRRVDFKHKSEEAINKLLVTLDTLEEPIVTIGTVSVGQATGRPLSHHFYRQGSGWHRQQAKSKPMVTVKSELDRVSYAAHTVVSPPYEVTRVVEERFLADTGASVCLAGTGYMTDMGVRQYTWSDVTCM